MRRRLRDGYPDPLPRRLEAPGWLRPLRNIFLSAILLLFVLIGGGILYTWYSDAQPKVVEETPKQTNTKVTSKAPVVDPNAPVSVAIQSLSSPVAPGDNASLTIRTKPTAVCTLGVSYTGATTPANDSGLVEKKADEYGVVTWSWTVPSAAQKALSPVAVRCELNDKSGELKTNLDVRPLPQT